MPARVLVFDSMGAFSYSIGREGDGPGEFRTPLVAASSRLLIVHDPRLARLSAFDSQGRLLWTKPAPCCLSHAPRIDAAGRIYALSSPAIIGAGRRWDDLIVFAPDGNPIDTLPVVGRTPDAEAVWTIVSPQAAIGAPIPFKPRPHFVVTRRGTILTSSPLGYTLIEGKHGRDTIRVVRPSWFPIPLSIDVRRAAVEAMIENDRRFVDAATLREAFQLADVPEVAPAVFGLDVDPCGRWWVQRTSGLMGPPGRFDVLDSTGSRVATVAVPVALTEYGAWAVGSGIVAAIVEGEDGAPTLGVFRIVGISRCSVR